MFFGASGDLAYKKIFPALQAIGTGEGKLDFPVGVVAKSGCPLDQLVDRARVGDRTRRRRARDVIQNHLFHVCRGELAVFQLSRSNW